MYDYSERWTCDGMLEPTHHALYVKCREQASRETSPTGAVMDTQSVKSGENGARLTRAAMMQARKRKARSAIYWSTYPEADAAKISRALVATLALSAASGCAQQASSPPHGAAATGPELPGAWYQVYFDTNSVAINDRGQMIVKNVAYGRGKQRCDARHVDR